MKSKDKNSFSICDISISCLLMTFLKEKVDAFAIRTGFNVAECCVQETQLVSYILPFKPTLS